MMERLNATDETVNLIEQSRPTEYFQFHLSALFN